MAAKFEQATEAVKLLPTQPSDTDKLYLYARFKQAKEGDNTTARPGLFELAGKAKWDAWTQVKGKSADEAKEEYVTKVVELLEASSSSLSAEAQKALADLKA